MQILFFHREIIISNMTNTISFSVSCLKGSYPKIVLIRGMIKMSYRLLNFLPNSFRVRSFSQCMHAIYMCSFFLFLSLKKYCGFFEQTVEIKVKMDCDGCERRVKNAVKSMKGLLLFPSNFISKK